MSTAVMDWLHCASSMSKDARSTGWQSAVAGASGLSRGHVTFIRLAQRLSMRTTEMTLNRDLARLGGNIPFLVEEFPNTRELWAELAGLIDDIQACAKPADREWVNECSDALLLLNGISSRAGSGDILEGATAMPAPSHAMRVEVASPEEFALGRDPDLLHQLRRQGTEYHHERAYPIRTEGLDRGLLRTQLQSTK
jgi:hypothetical protein